MTNHRFPRPRRIDLLALVGLGIVIPEVLTNVVSGAHADPTLVYSGMASICLWAGVRLDLWRGGL